MSRKIVVEDLGKDKQFASCENSFIDAKFKWCSIVWYFYCVSRYVDELGYENNEAMTQSQ